MYTIVFEPVSDQRRLQHIRLSDNGQIIGCFPIDLPFHATGNWVHDIAQLKIGDYVFFEKYPEDIWRFNRRISQIFRS